MTGEYTDQLWIPSTMQYRAQHLSSSGTIHTASCTKCGWDVNSATQPEWAAAIMTHRCGTPTPAVKKTRPSAAIRVTDNHNRRSNADDDYIVTCTVCGWQHTGNTRTELAETGNTHTTTNHPNYGRKPTLGEMVHYRSYGTPNGEYTPECRAAMVTYVGITGDPPATRDAVSLAVFNPDGIFLKANIPHDPVHKSGGTWHWTHD